MRIAVLVKQVPAFESMTLGPDGRLVREGLELEMNPYCRRAVAKGVELAQVTGGTCTAITLGPRSAEDCLREAIAWGADDGVLVTDPAFAGSDTLATARALAAAIRHEGGYDLVLVGRNSVDADTGQVGPELAELLDVAFATGVKALELRDGAVRVALEYDDAMLDATVSLPAVLSCAERLCDPAKVKPEGRVAVDAARIRRLGVAALVAHDLIGGPWGQEGSPTWVGDTRLVEIERRRIRLEGEVAEQVRVCAALLREWGALQPGPPREGPDTVGPIREGGPPVVVVIEPDRPGVARELLGSASQLAVGVGGHVVAFCARPQSPESLLPLSSWGADRCVALAGDGLVEEDVARELAVWVESSGAAIVLVPGTSWGRETASRAAARLRAGLTGDAVELGLDGDGRLLAWKPAFGGQMIAAIGASSTVQLATVRPGILVPPLVRTPGLPPVEVRPAVARGRVVVHSANRDDQLDDLALADRVVGVGQGVPPEEYPALRPLLDALGAELAATRKVTDKHWLPHARQLGITGRSISPRLYVALGIGGKFNHTVGVRSAGTIVAVNTDPAAPIFEWADVGLVADWRDVVPLLVEELASMTTAV